MISRTILSCFVLSRLMNQNEALAEYITTEHSIVTYFCYTEIVFTISASYILEIQMCFFKYFIMFLTDISLVYRFLIENRVTIIYFVDLRLNRS